MENKRKSIVVIGGGTGTYGVLWGLRDQPVNVTAILTMVDDGGSNRVLRDEFGLLPTSGVRLALAALSAKPGLLRELFTYRFHQGSGISGMTFGNLFLAAVTDIVGSQEKAIEQTAQLLNVKGSIHPISYDDVRLVAKYEDGSTVVGEHEIDEPKHDGKLRIVDMYTKPSAVIYSKADEAIRQADMIILGPGDFFTNTVANLVVSGAKEAIMASKAKLVFIVNLMNKYGEAYNYKASDYFKDMDKYLSLQRLDDVVINNDTAFPESALEEYKKQQSSPVVDDLDTFQFPKPVRIVRESVLSHKVVEKQKSDVLARSIIRHDSEKLAKVLLSLL